MATTTTSIRLNDDRLEQFNSIKASFDTGSDFADWIIETHKLYATSKESALFEQDGKAIADMFSSILAIYNGAIARAEGMVRAKDATIQEELRSKDMKQEELLAEIELLREELSLKDQEATTSKQSIRDIAQELKATQEALVKIQKDLTTSQKLNDMLESEKAQYAAISESNNTLINEVNTLKKELATASTDLAQLSRTLEDTTKDKKLITERLQAQIETIKSSHQNEVSSIKKDAAMALERVNMAHSAEVSKLSLDIERAVVDAHREAQNQVKEYMQAERELMKQIDELKGILSSEKHTNEELRNKISSLEADRDLIKPIKDK